MSSRQTGVIAQNRRARFDFEIIETVEAGLILTGSEVKSLRTGRARIAESYARPDRDQILLINAEIPPYPQAGRFNHEPKRQRVLLLSRREISRLRGQVSQAGATLVPLRLYFNQRGIAKLLLGVAKGRTRIDKRQIEKKRDWERQKAALLRRHS